MARRLGEISEALFFSQGVECKVLGLRLVHDLERGLKQFPIKRQQGRSTPQIFIIDPGPMARELGIGDIRPGDAFWQAGGDTALYRDFPIDTIASFIAAICGMHNPYRPTKFAWIFGKDLDETTKEGWTRCCSIQIPERELVSIRGLRDRLRGHARTNNLPWREPLRYYAGGPYTSHVARTPVPRPERMFICDLPVHEQFFHALLWELIVRAPCTATVELRGRKVVVRQIAGEVDAAQPLTRVMAQYQVGDGQYFLRLLEEQASTIKSMNGYGVQITKDSESAFSIAVEKPIQE